MSWWKIALLYIAARLALMEPRPGVGAAPGKAFLRAQEARRAIFLAWLREKKEARQTMPQPQCCILVQERLCPILCPTYIRIGRTW